MEGVAGVVSIEQVMPGTREYVECREWFMQELLALIDGLSEGGAKEISVYDEHWFGRNIDLGRLPRGVRAYCGKPPYKASWAGGLDASHDALILHGFHSMAGTGHTLCHTYEPDFRLIEVNGVALGEIGLETAIAGDWGVPLALVTADSGGVDEAQALVPGVLGVTTKISQSRTGAECLALADAVELMRRAAKTVAQRGAGSKPLRIEGPVTMRCQFNPGAYLEQLRRTAPRQFVCDDTIQLEGRTVTAVWADYWQLKLAAQSQLG